MDLTDLAKPWIDPISPGAPGGASAKFDPRYEKVMNEVAKLDSLSGGAVDWKVVVDHAGELLKTTSKDLLLGAHLAYGMYALSGLGGLTTGVAVLGGLLEGFWETMFPELKRIRGRANALGWFVERTALALERAQVGPADRAQLEALAAAIGRLSEIVRDRFGPDAPAMRPLADAVDRLILSLPAQAPPATDFRPAEGSAPPAQAPANVASGAGAAGPSQSVSASGASAPASAPSPASVSAAPLPASPATSPSAPVAAPTASLALPTVNPADPVGALRELGAALARAAAEIRRADPTQPGAYRALRVGLWLHLGAAPPAQAGGKTTIPAPPATLREKLDQLAANGKWPELVEEAESALTQNRLWLDLHRKTALGLANQGPSYAAAREAVLLELAAFLRRLPALVGLAFTDGTPLADEQTKAWLETEVMPPAPEAAAGKGAADDAEEAQAVAEARKLVAGGKAAEAVLLLQERVAKATTREARFRARLALARLCVDAGQPVVARALYDALDAEAQRLGLEEWDPGLAARCLEGYLSCLRALVKVGKATPADVGVIYDRLCRLDPGTALRAGP